MWVEVKHVSRSVQIDKMLMDEIVETTSPLVELHEFRSYCFRGEGRANFVVSAKCEKSGLRIVWRLAKHRKSGTVTIKPKCHVVIAYLEKLIVPVLGRQYLIKPKVVQIDVNSLHHLAKIPSLPLNMKVETFGELLNEAKFPASASFFPRRNIADGVDRVCALEMIDATCMPKHNESSRCYGPTITFEIKPKQGFFQNHPDVRVPYCNNCILQLEKCYSDAFEQMYDFCPLDLFSGDLQRMRCALNALVAVPHHNLRVFVDGTVVHSDEIRRSNEELTQTFRREYGVSFDQLLTALCCVLAGAPSDHDFTMHRSSVLAKLLRAQRIDTVGIVNAYRIYNRLSHNAQKELLNKCLLPRKGLSFLHKDTDRALIERYLLAATMKDCSLMVSLRLLDRSSCGLSAASSSEQFVQVLSPVLPFGTEPTATSSRECCFAFSINIVDLDPKSPKNLLNAYERFMNGVKIIENAPIDLRRPCLH